MRCVNASGQPLSIEYRAQLVITRGTVGRVPHIVFTRPEHLDGSVRRLRNQCCLHSVVVLQSPAKSSAHQCDIDLHMIGIESDGLRH